MEIVKEETKENTPLKKDTYLLLIVGVEAVGKQFLLEALTKIVNLSGYSVNLSEEEAETDFQILVRDEFDLEIEKKCSLLFSSVKNPYKIIEEEYSEKAEVKTDLKIMLDRFENMVKWMRSSKLAYCMDFSDKINEVGLHNYNNLRNIILPLNYAFQRVGMRFDQIKPQILIESLVPELAEKSKKASELFEKTKEEKLNALPEEKEEESNG